MNADAHTRWYRGISLGLALAVHGLLIGGGLLWRPAQETASDTAMTLVMVDLGMTPSAPPALPTEQPPSQPPPRPQAIQPPLPPEPPADAVLEHIAPIPEHSAEPAPEPPPEDAPAPSPAPPHADTAPAPQAAIQPAASTSRPQAVMNWQQQLLAHLQHYRRYPVRAKRLRQEGVSHVRFSVDRQGRISHPRIEQPSGHHLLDEETLATVHRANPVPPPPIDIPGNPVEVVVPVSFHLRRR